MGLLEDLAELKTAKPRTFKQWLETADEHDRTSVMEAVLDTSIPPNPLATMLAKRHGIPLTRETIQAYRDARG